MAKKGEVSFPAARIFKDTSPLFLVYEAPPKADLEIPTDRLSKEESLDLLLRHALQLSAPAGDLRPEEEMPAGAI